jgi:CDP-diacylglycerol--serine O-phosphatidyltransferase
MRGDHRISRKLTALLVYARPPLVFAGMLCAVGVMWNRSPLLYTLGVLLLFVSMTFDLVDGWFVARFQPDPAMAHLADRIMDKVVYSIIFPLIAVGEMWRLVFIEPAHTRPEMLHAIFILFLCVTVLVRDSFAAFMRGFAQRLGQEPEHREYTRLRTTVAAPVAALLYAHAFYVPEGPPSWVYFWISWLGNLPLRGLFAIEIIFLVINVGSIAAYCRKYGPFCLDDLCYDDERLRRRILSFFPNSLTVMNAMMGLMAVFFAYQGRIREAFLILIGATMFDKLDGAVARRLGLTEPLPDAGEKKHISLGAMLDDIADAVSFCIVPAWIYYILMTDPAAPSVVPAGWIACIYALMGIARLVYFTTDKTPIPGFFKGLPTPAAALLVVAPLIFFGQSLDDGIGSPRFWAYFCSGLMIFTALMMNLYPVRYLHYGRYMNRHPVSSVVVLFVTFIFVLTPYFGHFAVAAMLFYLVSPLWSWRISPKEAARETVAAP